LKPLDGVRVPVWLEVSSLEVFDALDLLLPAVQFSEEVKLASPFHHDSLRADLE
jgi:hypothetical protein